MDRNFKRGKLAQVGDCIKYAKEELSKLSKELADIEKLQKTGMYTNEYIEEMKAEKQAECQQKAQKWRQDALKELDALYNEIARERPEIMSENFQYACNLAQILGDSMTNEQAAQAIEPLRGKLTTIDVLRTVFEKQGAPTSTFDRFSLYRPKRDVIPEQTTESVFDETKRFLLEGNLFDGSCCLKQIANTLVGENVMDFSAVLGSDNENYEPPKIL